ncbi:cAMP phosphodiesterases class-II-domain-containing protein [Aspergillus avenaceus]|uniref:cAMP phosphodiesterases class-II-domain-containing protein n=1 Tax=Aspergillus avenaceus TaxID=36643 RepID=A0A5N6TWY6_ASPAV|nr:cAMP phosphodiesterases class-II-domain-containing protein [Aspergillus avenaceus]
MSVAVIAPGFSHGPTGGPREDRVTGLLVRSASTQWRPDSVIAVDAGTLLCGIIHILETHNDMDQMVVQHGPFSDMPLPFETAPANAAHIFREMIGPILVTHPHLDHVSGFAINSPILEATNGPKPVAALPSVITAIKTHIFNEVIWPNLSDEDGGAGLITYQRLMEGGNPRMGRDEERGYTRACEGLLYRCFSISHGCTRRRYGPETDIQRSISSAMYMSDPFSFRSASRAISVTQEDPGFMSPRDPGMRRSSNARDNWVSIESSAFFIRDQASGREVIIFGDVEPDSLSLDPRNRRVWETAAPRVAAGKLRAIFIECSYNDDVEDESLYGHLCPRHLIAELKVLASEVVKAKSPGASTGKRKRSMAGDTGPEEQPPSPKTRRWEDTLPGATIATSRSTQKATSDNTPDPMVITNEGDIADELQPEEPPLAGFSVYLIHIKDDMDGGPCPSETILQELKEHAQAANLGCRFHAPKRGESIRI